MWMAQAMISNLNYRNSSAVISLNLSAFHLFNRLRIYESKHFLALNFCDMKGNFSLKPIYHFEYM